jgi:hypothetical protein
MRSTARESSFFGISHRVVTLLAVVIIIGSVAACARIDSWFSPRPAPVTPVAQATVTATPTPTATVTAVRHRRRKKPSHGKRPPDAGLASATSSAPSPSVRPSPRSIPEDSGLTLENGDATMLQANRLIKETDQRLARIDARTIAGGDADTYRQASGLATQAHQAAERHDYAAACGLAGKAALLAEKLGATSRPLARPTGSGK